MQYYCIDKVCYTTINLNGIGYRLVKVKDLIKEPCHISSGAKLMKMLK